MEVTLGGERIGSGKKEKIHLRNYERSTHDLSYVWKSTMSAGTLVPFLCEIGLRGDVFKIDLATEVLTNPTIGPLFGSFKFQLDVYECPMRLYNPKAYMNKLKTGLEMNKVFLPQVRLEANNMKYGDDINNCQINSSSIFAYLGIRGIGQRTEGDGQPAREFNATSWLAYWDIVKNYYANKQEEIGYVIHNQLESTSAVIGEVTIKNTGNSANPDYLCENRDNLPNVMLYSKFTPETYIKIYFTHYEEFDIRKLKLNVNRQFKSATDVFNKWEWDPENGYLYGYGYFDTSDSGNTYSTFLWYLDNSISVANIEPSLREYKLSNIDDMREKILMNGYMDTPYIINSENSDAPYNLALKSEAYQGNMHYSLQSAQEGLAVGCYQSDLFNNWLNTEWLDGENGINDITRVSVTDDSFSIESLNLMNKVYNMLNRIAVTDGSYESWLDANYNKVVKKTVINPVYQGGLSKEIVFQQVISQSASGGDTNQPLGTLAGRGVLGKKHKGGHVEIRCDEPCYIIGIAKITPRLDYSQGNRFDVNYRTFDDLHKPALDEIGFQDLITDKMAAWSTGIRLDNTIEYESAGKQPAWIDYMTNFNRTFGNFAIKSDQMWMTLNRDYEPDWKEAGRPRIKDITTYIDPVKYNNIFAYTRRDAMNFWTSIGVDMEVRREMSAKVMPNL